MTIEWLSSKRMQGVTADTKPTTVPTGTEFMNTQTRVLSVFNGTSWDDVSGGGGSSNLDGLTDVDLTTDTPDNGDVLTYTSTGTKWVPAAPPGAGGTVTASSVTTFTNKSYDADGTGNSITNIENADIKAAAGIVTTKLADSANFILKTLDNSFGAHYQDFTKMTAPGNPGANDIRLYVDTTDTHLKIKNSAGTIVDLHSAGGSGAPTSAQYLTLATDGTLSAERVLTAGTNIAVVDGGAGSTATLNVPDASTTVKGAVELATDGETASSVVVQGSDTRLVRDLYEEMKTRTLVGEMDIQDANYGSGMFVKKTIIGTSASWADDTKGVYRYYGTGTTANTKTGATTDSNIFRRAFKPHLYFIYSIENNATNIAMFLGFTSSSTAVQVSATAPLASLSGIGLVALTSQTNLQIASNNGGATATLTDTGIARNSTIIRSFEVKNANDDGNWAVNVNNGEYAGTITTTVPAQTTDLYAAWHLMNTNTTDSYLEIYKALGKVTIL